MPGAIGFGSPSDRVTRSGGKKRINSTSTPTTSISDSLNLKKTRVSLQFDFGSPSASTKSPAIKKAKDNSTENNKTSELAFGIQSLLNVAAKHQCLQYLDIPKCDLSRHRDMNGQMRAIVPKQLEGIANLTRPVLSREQKSKSSVSSIIRPDAPLISINQAPKVPRRMSASSLNLQYIIVLDFESTCWEGRSISGPSPEIIEFPAVLINLQTGKIEDKFQQYVMPTEMSKLSDFCMNFTGISQSVVDNGVPLATCLGLFMKWVNSVVAERGLIQKTPHPVHNLSPTSQHYSFVTWTDWDLKVCLFQECSRKGLVYPPELNYWIDLKAAFRKNYGWMPKGLSGAIDDLGLTFEGREHCGLDDAKNTALLAHRMICDGALLDQVSEL